MCQAREGAEKIFHVHCFNTNTGNKSTRRGQAVVCAVYLMTDNLPVDFPNVSGKADVCP